MLSSKALTTDNFSEITKHSSIDLFGRRFEDPQMDQKKSNPFIRDHSRIANCRSFKRLQYKTQQFVQYEGDLRNRMTHTLFVEKVATNLGEKLGLNIPLIQAIALGHDLGHTPFGHVGERCLNALYHCYIKDKKSDTPFKIDDRKYNEEFKKRDGYHFKHNHHSVNIVEYLSKQYLCLLEASFVPDDCCMPGLNLTLAVVDGIFHHTKVKKLHYKKFREYYSSKLNINNSNTIDRYDYIYKMDHSSTLEGQLVHISDEIAQVCHDLEDGLKNKLIQYTDIIEHDFFEGAKACFISDCGYVKKEREKIERLFERVCSINKLKPEIDLSERKRYNSVRNRSIAHIIKKYLLNKLYENIENKKESILSKFQYRGDKEYICFDKKFSKELDGFRKDTIEKHIWNNSKTKLEDHKSQIIISTLFEKYVNYPDLLPSSKRKEFYKYAEKNRDYQIMPIINYISGMEDKYAIKQYYKLTTPHNI